MVRVSDDELERIVMAEFARLELGGRPISRDVEVTLARAVALKLRAVYETSMAAHGYQIHDPHTPPPDPLAPRGLSPELEAVAGAIADKLENGDASQVGDPGDYMLCEEDWDRVWERVRELQLEAVEAAKAKGAETKGAEAERHGE